MSNNYLIWPITMHEQPPDMEGGHKYKQLKVWHPHCVQTGDNQSNTQHKFAHHNCKYRLPQLSHHQVAQRIIKRNYLHESYGQVLSLTKDAGHKRSQTKEVFSKHAAHLHDWCAWYKNCNQLSRIHIHLLYLQ